MLNVDVRHTRNFALIGHAGDGKTSLGDSILHRAGATASHGHVDDGSSVLNYLPEERDGHIATISSHLFAFDWHDNHITLVDTPGDPNYQGDGQVALQALDGAVLVMSSVDGVKAGTEKMLKKAEEAGLPVVVFINGLDRDRADFSTALESLQQLGKTPVVLSIPVGVNSGLTGVVDLVRQQVVGADGSKSDVPSDLQEEMETRRMELVESVAECDDVLLERYLEEGELSEDEISAALVAGVRQRQLLPVLCGSALNEVGVDLILQDLIDLLPSPADRDAWEAVDISGDSEHPVKADPQEPFSAVVFKTVIDRYAGTLSVMRIVSGKLLPDTQILNATTGNKTRVGKLFLLQGEKHLDVPEAGPGDVVACAKLKDVHTGNVLTSEKGGVHLPEPTLPEGVLSYAIHAKSKGDDDKVFSALGRLVEEDPTLQLSRDETTGEFLLTGMGELHIRTTVHKLHRMFDLDVELSTPKVPYRETLTRKVSHVEGKLKKQSGGKGMFGVCYLDVEPLPRGEGVEFVDKIVGGSIPRNLIPAVEKGVLERCVRGPLAGYPIVDIRATCVDGKHHSVDSNEMAFKLAGSFALRAAMEQGRATILEPIMTAEICVPDDSVGDVMGDISSRRGRVQTSENQGTDTVVIAQLPMAEMLEYASSLTAMTGGKGSFHMNFAHYGEAPAHVREKIIAEAEHAEESEA